MKKSQLGMTLIELLAVVVILMILVTVAVPSFEDTLTRNRVEGELRRFSDQLKFARSTAVSRQVPVTICHVDPGTNSCDGVWSDGWTVFIDSDQDNSVDNTSAVLRVADSVAPNVLSVADSSGNAVNAIQISGRGYVTERMTIELCDKDLTNDKLARAVLLEQTGAAFMARINTSTKIYKDINGNDIDCDN